MTSKFMVVAAALLFLVVVVRAEAFQSQGANGVDRIVAANQKAVDDAKHGRYISGSYGYLAAMGFDSAAQISSLGLDGPHVQISDDDIYDQWSQVWSCMTGVQLLRPGKKPDYQVTPAEVAALKSAQGRAAIPEIVALAKKTRIVVLDEDHLVPRQREFALEVARALRPLGYTFLVVETLSRDSDDSAALAKSDKLFADGYVRQSSGYYTDDPVFADFLRQSMAMGYHLVSDEATKAFKIENQDEAQKMREQEQAENIVRRALRTNPNAKVLVYVGTHHAAERPIVSDAGKDPIYMAARLKHLTGIDPLTIDQSTLDEAPSDQPDVDLYTIASTKTKGQPVVLMSGKKPVTVGLLGGAVDLQVVQPRLPDKDGRPGWLISMGRKPVEVPPGLLPKSGVRLVQAFIATEAEDSIPVDQVLAFAGKPAPKLMLPNVVVRYAVQDYPSLDSPKEK